MFYGDSLFISICMISACAISYLVSCLFKHALVCLECNCFRLFWMLMFSFYGLKPCFYLCELGSIDKWYRVSHGMEWSSYFICVKLVWTICWFFVWIVYLVLVGFNCWNGEKMKIMVVDECCFQLCMNLVQLTSWANSLI